VTKITTSNAERKKLSMMRQALSRATTVMNIGGVEKRQGLPKPVTLPKVPLRDFDKEGK
jgi:hypothetical protein